MTAGVNPPVRERGQTWLGSLAQSSVPGAYAWFVTVVPTAWARGASLAPKLIAVAGLLTLALPAIFEQRYPRWARIVSVWGFVATSAAVWILVPSALAPTRLDSARGITGMIGWALFAYASAAPAVSRSVDAGVDDLDEPRKDPGQLKPRERLPRGDVIFVVLGIILAAGLQVLGWRIASPERAVLVRLVSIALGMAVIGAATSIALARHATRKRASSRHRLRATVPWILASILVGIAGLAYRLAH